MLVVLEAGCCGNTVVAVYWLQLQSETMTTGRTRSISLFSSGVMLQQESLPDAGV